MFLRLIFPILWKRYTRRQRIRATMVMIHARGAEFDNYLQRHNRFYRHLSVDERKRFLQRTVEFMKAKKFIYYELERDEKIALLVSAAAIQITFGLNVYLLDFFENIHILRNDYHYGG